jgi:hypothetical protein
MQRFWIRLQDSDATQIFRQNSLQLKTANVSRTKTSRLALETFFSAAKRRQFSIDARFVNVTMQIN